MCSIAAGCVPSEDEINEIISATEFEDSNGTIHLQRFLPHVTQLLAEHKWVLHVDFLIFPSIELIQIAWEIRAEWKRRLPRNYWKLFAYWIQMAKAQSPRMLWLNWWSKRENHSHRCRSFLIQFKFILPPNYIMWFHRHHHSGGIGRNVGDRCRHPQRNHTIRILHQFINGKIVRIHQLTHEVKCEREGRYNRLSDNVHCHHTILAWISEFTSPKLIYKKNKRTVTIPTWDNSCYVWCLLQVDV